LTPHDNSRMIDLSQFKRRKESAPGESTINAGFSDEGKGGLPVTSRA